MIVCTSAYARANAHERIIIVYEYTAKVSQSHQHQETSFVLSPPPNLPLTHTRTRMIVFQATEGHLGLLKAKLAKLRTQRDTVVVSAKGEVQHTATLHCNNTPSTHYNTLQNFSATAHGNTTLCVASTKVQVGLCLPLSNPVSLGFSRARLHPLAFLLFLFFSCWLARVRCSSLSLPRSLSLPACLAP